ncbi:murein hydrolase activator NlpD [Rosenbergiella australiborealis]|uniref:Murein hydrolase activator NlpD n=1 Tax=Rosenbergiella australiborealis TaxID=1544696 RepID=A0ABS5T6K0_9GAMM|nr:murein hydrolase activator NlpD [Rosenbergiella australiborealis]MBT0727988.1 murein hydrolase activator NlpD [Rosenbergiella australiborealis]
MSKGSKNFNYRQMALASLIAASLAGCSTESTDSQAPITAIGASGGAPRGSTQRAVSQYPSTIVPSTPSSLTSQPITQPQPVTHVRSAPVTEQAVISQPVKVRNGKIVYNRNYGNIPKGSYSGSTYTVKRGDTLFYIAWITGNDFRDLAQKNNVAAPYSLNAGQVLQIGNGAGQPITGPNEISKADNITPNENSANNVQRTVPKEVAQQPIVTYSEDNDEQSSNNTVQSNSKLLPGKTTVLGSAAAPIVAPTSAPTVSSTTSSTPITTWRWPTNGKIIDSFSAAEGGNKGIDIAGSRGQPVVSTAAGRVVYAGNALRGYGNLIIIKHNDDYLSAYAHNETMLVREQQEVTAGQKIATMGSTGTSSVRLHFEIRYKGKSVNPLRYLPQR